MATRLRMCHGSDFEGNALAVGGVDGLEWPSVARHDLPVHVEASACELWV